MKISLRLVLVLLIGLLLVGCASSVQFVNSDSAKLMPDSVARQILTKYFSAEWVQRPYLIPPKNPFCKEEKVPINLSEIKMVWYASVLKSVVLFDSLDSRVNMHQFDCGYDNKRLKISVLDESEAQQITEALIALGVPIRGYVKVY